MRLHLALLALLVAAVPAALGQSHPPGSLVPFRILIDVEAGEDTSLAQSYISRELRSLADVLLVDERPHYILRVVVIPLRRDGVAVAYAASFLVTGGNANDETRVDAWGIDPKARPDVLELLRDRESFLVLKVYTGEANALQDLCRRVAADIDTEILERRRRQLRSVSAPEAGSGQPPR